MPLANCKECNNQISDKAKTCPNCGAPLIKKKGGCLLNIIIIVVAVFIAWGMLEFASKGGITKDDCSGKEILAYNNAVKYVKQQLKSPGSAKFPETREKVLHTLYDSKSCSYKISSWVESQNSFGAMIKQNFECTIYFKGSTVSCSEIIFY